MTDDPGTGFGIVHLGGCPAPGDIRLYPLVHWAGRGFIDQVADGRGGTAYRCRVCGAVQGQSAAEPGPGAEELRRRAERVAHGLAPVAPPPPAAPPGTARGLTRRAILAATAAERLDADGQPDRGKVAGRLHTSESTLKRAMEDLEMGPWPPATDDLDRT